MTLTPEQDAAMRKAMEPVYKDVAGRVGQPLIDEFLKETQGRDQLGRHQGLPRFGAEASSSCLATACRGCGNVMAGKGRARSSDLVRDWHDRHWGNSCFFASSIGLRNC